MRIARNPLFRGTPKQLCSEELINNFEGRLIEDYERAVEEGVPPLDALAVVLAWVAAETRRLDPTGSSPSQSA